MQRGRKMSDTTSGRRRFLKSSLAGGAAFGMLGQAGKETHAAEPESEAARSNTTRGYLEKKSRRGAFTVHDGKRPHICLFTADMISPDCYLPSRELAEFVRLPNISAIGEAGTRFDNALCLIPLCGPSRASIFTGKYPPYLTNGERAPMGMKKDLHAEDTIFQEYLRASGYNTKHAGKCHVGTLKFMDAFGENDAAWDRWAPPLLDDDGYVSYLDGLGVQPPVYKKELRGKQSDRKSPGNSYGGWIMQSNGDDFPLEAHYSVYLARRAVEKLRAARIQTPDSPVYLQLDFFDPHQPFTVPAGFEQRARELANRIKLPESYRRIVENDFRPLPGEPDIYSVYRRYWGAYDPQLVRDYILCHALQMEVVDHAVGIVLDELKRLGMWDDSLVTFMGDHGEINGRLGLFDKGVYFHPDVFRVPLNIKLPSYMRQTLKHESAPVSTLDVSRTILGCAGIATYESYDGENLAPLMTGTGKRPVLEQVFQTGWHVGVNYGAGVQYYADAGHHWFYGYNISGGVQELYNMAEPDPVNVFHDPRHRKIAESMILRMGDILRSDPRWLGYWSTFRLHNADVLPRGEGDMQMFVPKKE